MTLPPRLPHAAESSTSASAPAEAKPPVTRRRTLTPPFRGEIEPGPVPTFSVVIAAYQAAETIAEAVESALSQSLAPEEVIVCDDGSTDDLAGALAPYAPHVRVMRQRNSGKGAAVDTGSRAASGEFVAILDADDVYLPGRLEALAELTAARPDLDIVTTDEFVEVDGRVVGRFYERNVFPVEVAEQRTAILRTCFVGGHPAVRRSVLLENGGFDRTLRIGEDWECWLRLILAGCKAGMVDEPLLRYRLHEGGLTSNRLDALLARVRVLEKHEHNPALTAQERGVLTASLAANRRRLALAEVELAFTDLPMHGRRRALALIARRDLPWVGRLTAAAALVMPRWARRMVEWRVGAGRAASTSPRDRWRD